jgi:pimeloyl-ACP methyl ester carboxylesterase
VRTATLPTTSKGAGWRYGVDGTWFKELIAYWQRVYNWKKIEAKLNRTPRYLVSIEGRALHYAHLTPRRGAPRKPPILLLHGWPYSFATMLPLAGQLADSGYEVVVPSLPGSVFSEPVDNQVRGLRSISRRIGQLMTEVLGHERFLIHGGDHGAVVADWLGIDTPDNIIGLHTNLIAVRQAGAPFGSGQTGVPDPTPEEVAYVETELDLLDREFAYFRLQLTRPETIAYALSVFPPPRNSGAGSTRSPTSPTRYPSPPSPARTPRSPRSGTPRTASPPRPPRRRSPTSTATKWPKATARITEDLPVLLEFYYYPAERWVHLRTTNLIESTFATVRLGQRVTKGPGSRAAGVAMAFKFIESAQQRWRAVKRPTPCRARPSRRRFEKGPRSTAGLITLPQEGIPHR